MRMPTKHQLSSHLSIDKLKSMALTNNNGQSLADLAQNDGGPFVLQGGDYWDTEIWFPETLTGKVHRSIHSVFENWTWNRLNVQEIDGDNGQVRFAHLSRWDGAYWALAVRSDQDLYTDFDDETRLVQLRNNRVYPSKHPITEHHKHWVLMREHEADWWAAEMACLFSLLSTEAQIATFYRSLRNGCVAHPGIVQVMERMIREDSDSQIQLNRFRDRMAETRVRNAQSNALFKFWYQDSTKARIGAWKMAKLPQLALTEKKEEFSLLVCEQPTEKKKTLLQVSNGHAQFEFALDGVIGNMEAMTEVDLLRHIVGMPANPEDFDPRKKQLNASFPLKINGVPIEFDYKFHRLHVFGKPLKKSELVDILVECCCYKTKEEMEELVSDCAKLSLTYRNYLTEGIRRKAYIQWREKTTDDYYTRHHRGTDITSVLGVTATTLSTRSQAGRCLVQGEVPMRFDVVRRKNGGLALTHKGKEYPVYPDDLLKKTSIHGSRSIYQVVASALQLDWEAEGTQALVKNMVWTAVAKARVVDRNSRQLLKEVCEELEATKETLFIENKSKSCYIILGTSGTRYAVEDAPGKAPIYREDTDSTPPVWRFVCVESTGDMNQEQGKDNLVTRLYALADDVESSTDITTLKVGKVAPLALR